ncbi:hypothetical protein CS0771_41320 [Catellatospora sp. IY07-71]|uniref:protein phosphatase 2C domain-containing protein n=1 Tax=Catellatospora sp. IY07-71 TaxID=2728827 RepID=UPI001BB4066F|nr:protein phosphatase 2C domain-containing protein [Catellatospora sp. IY07-71]BCJ74588.1 hypothetical protein CS0771_41320 [Catellatospora sp. IY07-71]
MGRSFAADWRLATVSVPGPSHTKAGKENQDAVRSLRVAPDRHLFAVADGAGSQERSALGARIAVDVACEAAAVVFAADLGDSRARWESATIRFTKLCFEWFDQRVLAMADTIREQGDRLGHGSGTTVSVDDFATTLLAVLVCPPWFCVLNVGDGFMVLRRRPGGLHLVVAPPLNRSNAGLTTFLTSPSRNQQPPCFVVADPRVTGLAISTDGLVEALLEAETIDDELHHLVPARFHHVFTHLDDPQEDVYALNHLLSSDRWAATSNDDKTMALAVLRDRR